MGRMGVYKSPAKTAIMEALRQDQRALEKWEVIRAERAFQAQEMLEQEWEAREEINRILDAIEAHYEALRDVGRSERTERRRTAA